MRIDLRTAAAGVALLCGLSLGSASCGGSEKPSPPGPSPGPPAAPTVTSVQVTGLPASLAPGETAQLTARASLSDGSSQDVTAQAAWRSETGAVATVSSGGLVTAVAAGTTEIRATYQSVSAGAMLEVRQGAPPPPRRYSVCGDVTELGAGPLAGANVEVRDGLNARRITETDAAGGYCLRDLMADSFLLRALKGGYDDVDERVTLNADTTVRFTIKKSAVPLYSLCGTIRETASAAVVSGVLVEIRSGTNAGKNATSDGAGKYCLTSLQADSFTVRASKAQYNAVDRPVTLAADATLDINLLVSTPTVTIRPGGVMSPSPITIAAGQRVTFVNANSIAHQISSDPHPIHTDCPELNLQFLTPGQSGSSAVFTRAGTCGYHDHLNSSLTGRVIIR